jgi:hypothetical protein
MFTTHSARKSIRLAAALFSLVLVAAVSPAYSAIVTYALVPYQHTDLNSPNYTDYLTGSITVSSASDFFGTWGPSSLPPPDDLTMSVDLEMKGAFDIHLQQSFLVKDMIYPLGWIQYDGVTFTPTSISLPDHTTSSAGGYLNFNPTNGDGAAILAYWAPGTDNGVVSMFARTDPYSGNLEQAMDHNGNLTYGSGSWLIATADSVPEPATFTLFAGLGVLALSGTLLRRLRKPRT